MPLSPRDRLGPYEIVASLGAGGMGEVYRGLDTRMGRPVAIKVVNADLASDPRYRERLKREASSIAKLRHPNICSFYDIGSEGDLQYLIMEYLDGVTLTDRLKAGPIAPEEAVKIGAEIAAAVDAAHRKGIVHRDLKPGNVMIGSWGAKVVDFGLAKAIPPPVSSTDPARTTIEEPLTRQGAVVGTLPYMAPEQLVGGEVGPRSDIWALGCILYETTTGSRPFRAGDDGGLVHRIMTTEPEGLTSIRDAVTPGFERIVTKCLEKDPGKRYGCAEDLLFELEATHAAVSASGAEQIDRKPTKSTSSSGIRVLLAVAAVLLGALFVGSRFVSSDPPLEGMIEGAAIAVLPFDNLTGNDQLEYIGKGLAAGVNSQLAELPGIEVVGRKRALSAFERGGDGFAEELGVNYVIEGGVQSGETELSVAVAIVDSQTSIILWAETFDGTRDSLHDVQQDIVRSIARVVSVPLSREQRRRLTAPGPSSRAFHFYLQGIERLEQRGNLRSSALAADLFRQAIRIDGEVAAFYAALSRALSQQIIDGTGTSETLGEEAKRAAETSLRLDPKLADGYIAQAQSLRALGRYAESIATLRPVLADLPRPDVAFIEIAFGYDLVGDEEAAAEALDQAAAMAPDDWFIQNALGVRYVDLHSLQEAQRILERAVELAPDGVVWPQLNLVAVKIMQNDPEGAIADFEAAGATTTNPDLASNMGTAYFFSKRLDEAERLYRLAVELDPNGHFHRRNLGDALLEMRRKAEAMREYSAASRIVEERLREQPHQTEFLRVRALYAAKIGDCALALEYADDASPFLGSSWDDSLDMAMTYALCDRKDEALTAIEACLSLELPRQWIREQPEFRNLAEDPDFIELIAGDD